jgi:Tyrosine-protein kinase ephrin type A/B receptor-like
MYVSIPLPTVPAIESIQKENFEEPVPTTGGTRMIIKASTCNQEVPGWSKEQGVIKIDEVLAVVQPGDWRSTEVIFTMPAGQGQSPLLELLDASNQRVAVTMPPDTVYDIPKIEFVSPSCGAPPTGGITLEIRGSNFGTLPKLEAIDQQQFEPSFLDPSHQQVNFVLPYLRPSFQPSKGNVQFFLNVGNHKEPFVMFYDVNQEIPQPPSRVTVECDSNVVAVGGTVTCNIIPRDAEGTVRTSAVDYFSMKELDGVTFASLTPDAGTTFVLTAKVTKAGTYRLATSFTTDADPTSYHDVAVTEAADSTSALVCDTTILQPNVEGMEVNCQFYPRAAAAIVRTNVNDEVTPVFLQTMSTHPSNGMRVTFENTVGDVINIRVLVDPDTAGSLKWSITNLENQAPEQPETPEFPQLTADMDSRSRTTLLTTVDLASNDFRSYDDVRSDFEAYSDIQLQEATGVLLRMVLLTCPIGTYEDITGNCVTCSQGYTREALNTFACSQCAAGEEPNTEATQCVKCIPGRFNPTAGDICQDCPAGFNQTAEGKQTCLGCPMGQYQPDVARLTCIDCTEGYYSNDTGSVQCTACGPGYRSDSSMQSAGCSECPMGSEQPLVASDSCASCPPGFITQAAGTPSCSACPSGSAPPVAQIGDDQVPVVSRTECTLCQPGKYASAAGQASCFDCNEGEISTTPGATSCAPCEPGTKWFNTTSCVACAAGRFTDKTRDTVCRPCEKGTSTKGNTGQAFCTPCEPGTFQSNGAQPECIQCNPGTYAAGSGATVCDVCISAGQQSNIFGASSCASCQSGEFANGAECELCPAGRYSLGQASGGCLACPRGRHVSSQGSSECFDCVAGRFSPRNDSNVGGGGASECIECGVGHFSALNASCECSPCLPGHNTSLTTATSCDMCAPGTFQNLTAQGTCAPCNPGSATGTFASSSCYLCPSGRYQPMFGATKCILCPNGTFASGLGANECQPCPLGSVAETDGRSVCSLCSRGKYSFSTSTCRDCPLGTFSAEMGQGSCDLCDPGTAATVVGSWNCSACPAGSHPGPTASQRPVGGETCSLCPAGRFSNSSGETECTECPVGYYTNTDGATYCRPCDPGTAQNNVQTGAKVCENCVKGTFASSAASAFCALCPIGTSAASEGTITCEPCAIGKYGPIVGLEDCLSCANNTNVVGAISCDSCSPGSFVDPTDGACVPCAPGRFSSISAAATCIGCSPGFAAPSPGSSSCISCSPGTFSSTHNATACTSCEIGKFQSAVQSDSCVACDLGTSTTSVGAIECSNCEEGTFRSNSSIGTCQSCPKGRFNDDASSPTIECEFCPRGQFSNSLGQVNCANCLAGSYANVTGSTSCPACSPGTHQPITGQGRCEDCAPGLFADGFGRARCTACDSGRYSNINGTSTCIDCIQGTFSRKQPGAKIGPVQCDACRPGEFGDTPGAFQCTLCPRGKFSNATRSPSCYSCPSGTFQDEQGQQNCETCLPGRFAGLPEACSCVECGPGTIPNADNTECETCPGGRFSNITTCSRCPRGLVSQAGQGACAACTDNSVPNAARTNCLQCDKGEYMDVFAIECRQCPPGSFTAGKGERNCLLCPAGKTAAANGSTSCTDCPAGSASNTAGAAKCAPCPQPSFQSATGQTSCAFCEFGTYVPSKLWSADTQAVCAICPEGLNCPGDGKAFAAAGYYAIETAGGEFLALKCLEKLCVDNQCAAVSNSTGAGAAEQLVCGKCGPNRRPFDENPLCGQCLDGYYEWNKECVLCESTRWDLMFLFFIASFFFVLAMHVTSQSTSGDMKIFMYFVQMSVLFVGADLDWATWLQVFNLDVISSSGSTCIFAIDQHNRMMLAFLLPVVSLCQLGVLFVIHWLLAHYRGGKWSNRFVLADDPNTAVSLTSADIDNAMRSGNRSSMGNSVVPSSSHAGPHGIVYVNGEYSTSQGSAPQTPRTPGGASADTSGMLRSPTLIDTNQGAVQSNLWAFRTSAYIRTLIGLFLFSYNIMCNGVFDYFNCIDIGDGREFVVAYPAVDCSSIEYNRLMPAAVFALIATVLVIPGFFLHVLVRAYQRGHLLSYTFSKKYGILNETYDDKLFFWEIVAITRRTILVAVFVFMNEDRVQKFSVLSIFNVLFLAMHIRWVPFYDSMENMYELGSLSVLCLITLLLPISGAAPYSPFMSVVYSFLVFGPIMVLAGFAARQGYHRFKEEWSRQKRSKRKNRKNAHSSSTRRLDEIPVSMMGSSQYGLDGAAAGSGAGNGEAYMHQPSVSRIELQQFGQGEGSSESEPSSDEKYDHDGYDSASDNGTAHTTAVGTAAASSAAVPTSTLHDRLADRRKQLQDMGANLQPSASTASSNLAPSASMQASDVDTTEFTPAHLADRRRQRRAIRRARHPTAEDLAIIASEKELSKRAGLGGRRQPQARRVLPNAAAAAVQQPSAAAGAASVDAQSDGDRNLFNMEQRGRRRHAAPTAKDVRHGENQEECLIM